MYSFLIYTDGSANSGERGGSACIVEDPQTLKSYNLFCSFGPSSNNQAELFATFLGYAFIRVFAQQQKLKTDEIKVTLVSDSEYVLKGSTQYIHDWRKHRKWGDIKNSHFWKAFLAFSYGYNIIPQHVVGHTGHIENEKCDFASGWIRKTDLDIESGTPVELQYPTKRGSKIRLSEVWFYVDLSKTFADLREGRRGNYLDEILGPVGKVLDLNIAKTYTIKDRAMRHIKSKANDLARLCHNYSRTIECEKISDLSKELIKVLEKAE